MLHKVGKVSFVLGIDWHIASDRKTAARLRKQFKGKRVLTLRPEDQDFYLLGFADKTDKGVSAAAAIARVLGDGCFIVELDDEQVWLCYTTGGLPAPGYDKIVDKNRVKDEIAALAEATGGDIAPKIYAFDEENVRSRPDALWNELADAVLNKEIERIHEITIGAVNPSLVVAAAGLLISAGIVAWPYVKEQFFPEPPAVVQVPAIPVVHKPTGPTEAELRAQKLQKLTAAFNARLETAKRQLTQGSTMNFAAVMRIIDELPVQMYGYQPQKLTCTLDKCELIWQAAQTRRYATIRLQDRLLLPHVDREATLKGTDTQAHSVWTIKPETVRSPVADDSEVMRLKTLDAWRLTHLKAPHAMSIAPLQAVTVKGAPEAHIADRTVGWKAIGTWRSASNNAGIDALWDFVHFANAHSLAVNKIEMQWQKSRVKGYSADFSVSFLAGDKK